ncbi:MAG: hypothetical protein ONB11_05290 [candidate division KSB1 bacterium]|nr:hypothetical protein [candidate division KSB1 bacterium]
MELTIDNILAAAANNRDASLNVIVPQGYPGDSSPQFLLAFFNSIVYILRRIKNSPAKRRAIMAGKRIAIGLSIAFLTIILLTCGNQKKREQAEGHYQTALALLKVNQTDSALKELQQTIKLDPTHIKAHQRYAYILRWEKNQAEEVLAEYQEKARKNPRNEIYQYMLGYLSDDTEEIKARAEKCLQLNPHFYHAYALMGEGLIREQDYEAAIAQFKKVLAVDSLERSSLQSLAFAYSRIDSFDLSNQIYRTLIRLDTTIYFHYYSIWRNMLDKEGLTPATKEKIDREIDALLSKNPSNLTLLQAGIYTYQMLGERNKAAELEEKVIRLDTTGDYSQSIIFNRMYEFKDPQERLKYAEKFLADYPKSQMRSYIYSYIFRMMSYELKSDTTAMIEWGERRIKDFPDDADAYNDLVWQIYQFRPDKLDVALEYMKKAVAVAKPHQKNYVTDTLGWIYFKKGLYPEALSILEQANGLYDDPDADVIFHLGAAQGKNGKIDEALQTLSLALSLQEIPEAHHYFNEFYQAKFGHLEGVEEYLKKTILGKAVVDPPFTAPEFKLTSMDGREVGLSDYKNKVILVAFWKPT